MNVLPALTPNPVIMKFSSRILDAIKAPGYRPTSAATLARLAGIDKKVRRQFSHELRLLLARGELILVSGDKITLPVRRDTPDDKSLVGRLQFRAGGSAYVLPAPAADAKPGDPFPPSIQIAPEDVGLAFHGDTVRVRILSRPRRAPRKGREDEQHGKVTEIVERAHASVVGTLHQIRKRFYVAPDDPRFIHEIAVEDPASYKLPETPGPGDKVVVRLHAWDNPNRPPEGKITERLGKTFEPRAELLGVYRKFNLDPTFPSAVQAEVRPLPDHVEPAQAEGRLDYRGIPTFTIDPDDAKDFDDALSFEEIDGGLTRIGVHIADVSAYVKPGTTLDREAQKRGNSTYLVGTVVPMLPEKISNGLCSLVEGQDRLTKAAFLVFDTKGRLQSTSFANTIIRSRKRLTYKQAYALLFTDDLAAVRKLPLPPKHQTGSTGRALSSLKTKELADLQGWIRQLWSIASRLRVARMKHGSLDLDMPETKVFVDEQGYADRLEKIEHDESHQLIEEFMLAANEAIAHLTKRERLPSLYRVHDDPDDEKLGELRQTLGASGIQVGDLTNRTEINKVLVALKTHPQGHLLRINLLRSLKKAAYRASADGHYGLAKKDYTHFTSPIRRYADLVVHRVLDAHLARQGGGDQHLPGPDRDPAVHPGAEPAAPRAKAKSTKAKGDKLVRALPYTQAQVDAMGEHLSLTEVNSAEAERESVKIKTLEFFEREMAKPNKSIFSAIITEVRPHGLFIELTESLTFGFVPTGTLPGDFYHPADDNTALVGRRHKRRFELGGTLQVTVGKVDRVKRLIDFRAAEDPS